MTLMTALFSGVAQDHELMDSLRRVIPTRKDDDSMKVLQMNSLAFEYSYIDLDSGKRIAEKALELAEATNFKRGKAGIYNTIGTIYHDQANFQKAVECFTIARKFSEQGTYKSMKHMSAVIYANLANTYESMGDYGNAKHYMFESLRMFRELKDSKRFTSCYLNIGILYFESGNTDSAMYYYNEAIKFPSEKAGINASVHTSIAKCYLSKNQLEEAEKEMLIALDIIKDLNSEYYEASYTNSLGEIYIRQGKYNEAEKLLLKSLNYAKHAKLLSIETSANYNLYELYMAKKQFQKALDYHVQYTFLNDSINNKERNNAARELEKKYQTEKKQTEIEKLNAEKNASESESKRKSQLLMVALVSVIFVLCALGYAIYAFINKRKANKQLQALNKEVLVQKDELQDKNKSITDSIHYAQRIQNVLLTSHSYIKENLDQFFILNKPKDIVSGDFYWAIRHKNHFYFMVADCTGHGVPGAFMSLLGINFLNEIVLERGKTEPNEILDDLRAEIKKAFTDKDTNNEMNDGMDCALCKFDLTNNTLDYAAANNSIVVVRNNEVMHLTGDKMPVGKSPRDTVPFTLNQFQLEKGDTLYMFTDGYPDQFGGEQGKKFKVKNVKQLLLQMSAHELEKQHELLNEYFESWRGNLEQIDDVLMVGIRI